MLPTTHSVPDGQNTGSDAGSHSENKPFTLIDFVEAAEALARGFLKTTESVITAGETSPILYCTGCQRAELASGFVHAPSCLAGTVLAMAEAWRSEQADRVLRKLMLEGSGVGTIALRAEHVEVSCEVDDSGPEIGHYMILECVCGMFFVESGPQCKRRARTMFESHLGTPFSREANLDIDACGDSFFDPVSDGQFWCSLRSGHEGDHFDELLDYRWGRDEDIVPPGMVLVSDPEGGTSLEPAAPVPDNDVARRLKLFRFDGPVGGVCGNKLHDPVTLLDLVCILPPNHVCNHQQNVKKDDWACALLFEWRDEVCKVSRFESVTGGAHAELTR